MLLVPFAIARSIRAMFFTKLRSRGIRKRRWRLSHIHLLNMNSVNVETPISSLQIFPLREFWLKKHDLRNFVSQIFSYRNVAARARNLKIHRRWRNMLFAEDLPAFSTEMFICWEFCLFPPSALLEPFLLFDKVLITDYIVDKFAIQIDNRMYSTRTEFTCRSSMKLQRKRSARILMADNDWYCIMDTCLWTQNRNIEGHKHLRQQKGISICRIQIWIQWKLWWKW